MFLGGYVSIGGVLCPPLWKRYSCNRFSGLEFIVVSYSVNGSTSKPWTWDSTLFLFLSVVVVEFEVKERTIGTRRNNLLVRPNGYTRFFLCPRVMGLWPQLGSVWLEQRHEKDTDVLHWRSSDIVSLSVPVYSLIATTGRSVGSVLARCPLTWFPLPLSLPLKLSVDI